MKKLWSNMTDKLISMLLIYFYVSSIYNNIINYIIFIYLLMCGPWHHEVSEKESGEIKMPVWQTKDSRKPPQVTCKKDSGLDGDWLMMDTRHWFWVNWPLDLSDTLLEKVLTFSAQHNKAHSLWCFAQGHCEWCQGPHWDSEPGIYAL